MRVELDACIPSEFLTVYTFECVVCSVKKEERINGQYTHPPSHPGIGWRMFNHCWVCPDHKISIVIDGAACKEAFGYQFEPLTVKADAAGALLEQ